MPSDEKQDPQQPAVPEDGDATAPQTNEPARAVPDVAPGAEGPTSPLTAAIAALQQDRQQVWDRLLRTAAELENFKKRSKRDLTDARQRAEDRVVLEFLPVIDNLERALDHLGEEVTNDGGLADGVKMVHKQFLATLEKFEIRPLCAEGQPFDPEFHEAVQQLPADQPAGTVFRELQRGYCRGERLVRPALVVVSSGPAAAGQTGATTVDGSSMTTEEK